MGNDENKQLIEVSVYEHNEIYSMANTYANIQRNAFNTHGELISDDDAIIHYIGSRLQITNKSLSIFKAIILKMRQNNIIDVLENGVSVFLDYFEHEASKVIKLKFECKGEENKGDKLESKEDRHCNRDDIKSNSKYITKNIKLEEYINKEGLANTGIKNSDNQTYENTIHMLRYQVMMLADMFYDSFELYTVNQYFLNTQSGMYQYELAFEKHLIPWIQSGNISEEAYNTFTILRNKPKVAKPHTSIGRQNYMYSIQKAFDTLILTAKQFDDKKISALHDGFRKFIRDNLGDDLRTTDINKMFSKFMQEIFNTDAFLISPTDRKYILNKINMKYKQ